MIARTPRRAGCADELEDSGRRAPEAASDADVSLRPMSDCAAERHSSICCARPLSIAAGSIGLIVETRCCMYAR